MRVHQGTGRRSPAFRLGGDGVLLDAQSHPRSAAHSRAKSGVRHAALAQRIRQLVRQTQSANGHLYQGRYKSFLVENDSYFWTLSRYIHLNPCRRRQPLAAEPAGWCIAVILVMPAGQHVMHSCNTTLCIRRGVGSAAGRMRHLRTALCYGRTRGSRGESAEVSPGRVGDRFAGLPESDGGFGSGRGPSGSGQGQADASHERDVGGRGYPSGRSTP